MNERQNNILAVLTRGEKKSVNELSGLLGVSSVTIRQDLSILEKRGFLKRIHGGAVLSDADDISVRLGINYFDKLKIARKTAGYVKEGETILIESGSTNALLANELVKTKRVTILTTNLYIARQFRDMPKANIILMGGLYQHESESLVGMLTKTCIDSLNFSKAFIGIDGFESSTGFTSRDMLRAEISAYIIKKSPEVFVVTDSSKFGRSELATICQAGEIKHLVTDGGIGEKYTGVLRDQGVDVVIA